MDLRGQHEDATEVNEWIKFGMRIAVSVKRYSKCIRKIQFFIQF